MKAHSGVAEAVAVAMPHRVWMERPMNGVGKSSERELWARSADHSAPAA